ncbi:dihydroorotase [Candidatus Poribacteria bacterium]|nr:dihydroorotase [Candidatus Poribacteria bacterium]|tara:strand:+ start:151 stop:1443 length:1293 start_codon:yes stop_codon:yes gene_type:complete
MKRTLIKNGRMLDPKNSIDQICDLYIEGGNISQIGIDLNISADQIIEAKDLIVTPGLVDMHVHLREPGFEYKETIATGTRSAVAGGFTTVACMANTKPTIDSPDLVDFIHLQAKEYGSANVLPIGAITKDLDGKLTTDWRSLIEAGVVALSDDGKTVMDASIMWNVLVLSAEMGFPVIDHCEEHNLTKGTVMNLGKISLELGLPGQSNAAEEIIIARDLLLAEQTGGHVHIAHVSTEGGVDLIHWAKQREICVTAEACPHHFTITDAEVVDHGAKAKVHPPLRTQKDVEAIIHGLAEGIIDTIATDHAPHASFEKDRGMQEAPAGIIGLETSVPLVLTKLVNTGKLELNDAIAKMTHIPSEILGIDRGTLSVDAVADVTLIDPKKLQIVDSDQFESKSKNTPFDGWELEGWPVMTIRGGEIMMSKIKGNR